MAVCEIRVLGDPVLRTAAEEVSRFDAQLTRLVQDLTDTLDAESGRAGLAAPQVGVGLRAFVYDIDEFRGHVINPVLELSSEQEEDEEGCLSIPGLWFSTPRASRVTCRGVDTRGEPVTVQATGQLARCLQHETDHLDGIVYVDRLEHQQRREAMRELRAALW